ncbi:hypothetical protein F0562_022680 [Nyssa sinensis]|uniref:PUM-HD domain-containing protein n=1 Tax=Nyssa sinensis TaxID=561372 RepID=A0A5J5BFS4_9ASTE|nr:hypothetical protein F0562_022680 [Nyssa sinensis]
MQYFQHPIEDAGASGQYGRVGSTGVTVGQINPFVLQKESTTAAYMADQKFQPLSNVSPSIPSPREGVFIGSSYYRSPPSMGVMAQFPASPLGSPILPGSPVAGANPSGRRNEMKFHQGSIRNVGVYSGLQGQRGADNYNDPTKNSFLEELKSSSARKIELSDIAGHIVEFSVDQHGSRFIQQKLENCSVEGQGICFQRSSSTCFKINDRCFWELCYSKVF